MVAFFNISLDHLVESSEERVTDDILVQVVNGESEDSIGDGILDELGVVSELEFNLAILNEVIAIVHGEISDEGERGRPRFVKFGSQFLLLIKGELGSLDTHPSGVP
jgi:hypothetical protein